MMKCFDLLSVLLVVTLFASVAPAVLSRDNVLTALGLSKEKGDISWENHLDQGVVQSTDDGDDDEDSNDDDLAILDALRQIVSEKEEDELLEQLENQLANLDGETDNGEDVLPKHRTARSTRSRTSSRTSSSRTRQRSRSRSRSRDRRRDRSRSRDRARDRARDRTRERSRERNRDRSRTSTRYRSPLRERLHSRSELRYQVRGRSGLISRQGMRIRDTQRVTNVLEPATTGALSENAQGRLTQQYHKNGNFQTALNDFNAMQPSNIREVTNPTNGIRNRIGTLPDGRTVIARDGSSGEGHPTLEIQDYTDSSRRNQYYIKVRYNSGGSNTGGA
ncbi:serine/threonine-protein kinase fray2 [Aplysia californica]|uniref:Serine/threonine-protein kinase fray2 n=1 Tax=Aplysia californica TaxID=6500 RepID=A0ABM1A5S4_APLCA|nr:serine/threonine-protein kinase fray2 [Aplysia californica]XP_012941369.1 serine/threonine-protein kinase fray2 [Aplysia californica]XP_035827220.1 serine/threonine-protein kinase fray2 [Aplysia californica]